MTTTSGPGISLMSEFVGLGYYAEVPAVIVDVQRVGPSTGLPTRTMQGDILSTYFLSHGDTRHILLIPGSVQECYELTMEAFDLAERFQTPVFVMTDLDLGMNNWMSDPFAYPEKPIDRGKVIRTRGGAQASTSASSRSSPATTTWTATASRTARCPASSTTRRRPSSRAARATRSARPTPSAPTTTSATWTASPASSRRRGASCRSRSWTRAGSRIGVIAYGSSDFAVQEARHLLAAQGAADRLAAPAGPPADRGGLRLRRRARPRVRRRPEPRRADARHPAPGDAAGRRREAASPSATTTASPSTPRRWSKGSRPGRRTDVLRRRAQSGPRPTASA